MPKTLWPLLLLSLVATLLAGCGGISPQSTGAQQAAPERSQPPPNPQPEQIVISDGVTPHTFRPDDAVYAAIARKLDELVAAMDTPLYAYYPPERVASEIAPLPHLEATYGRNVTLVGKGYQVEAERLIVVIANGEKIILTHAEGHTNWDACEESGAVHFDALLKTIKSQTGVNLSS